MTEILDRIGGLSPAKQRLLQQKLRQRSADPGLPPLGPVSRRGAGDRLPCSFAQQRLWFLYQLDPESPAYNVPMALRLSGALDAAALARSLTGVVRRHEVLRSTFGADEEGFPFQAAAPPAPVPLPVVDLSALPGPARESELRQAAEADAFRPFDLQRGPVLRATLLRLDRREHALLLSMHHIVSDGWSRGLLLDELAALYGGASLPGLPIQYADFAAWQRGWLRGEALAGQLAHWKARLQGAPPLLELPTDRPRPAAPTFRGGVRAFTFPGALAEQLAQLARGEGTTLFGVLLTAFQALLSRWSGQTDLCVGTPVAGRRRREVETLIGFFINMLVMRADLAADPRFRSALRANREELLEADAHQDLPFERLVEELRIERSLSHAPLFQVALAFQNTPSLEARVAGLEIAPIAGGAAAAKFDLTVGLAQVGSGLQGAVEHSADLFDPATIDRLVGHLRVLLEGVAADPSRRISELPLLTADERRQILDEARGTSRVAVAAGLHELFAAQAERSPEAVAVVCGEERLSYGELRQRAWALARRLRAAGVGPEARIGLCAERSLDLVAGMLGILAAGGAYVPLDPAYPEERLRLLVDDAGIAALLAQTSLLPRLPAAAVPVIALDAPGEDAPGMASPAPSLPDSLAYVIYTSGSTGRPKGVAVTHANVVRLLEVTRDRFGFGPSDVWTLFHSHAFDFSVWEIWGALAFGGRLVVVPYGVSRSPADFHALLRREGVTVLNQTPSAFRNLIEEDLRAGGDLALRWVIFGGEALDPQFLRPWLERHGDRRPALVNMYGITETTVHVTWRWIESPDAARGASSRIGAALPDLSLYLLDCRMEPVPTGVPGEIHVGGAGLARGYLGSPDLTAARFVPDPFGAEPGGRLYRSGDLARRLRGGDVEYLGRIDLQVKIRGFRIELGEVEAALLEHPGVRQAVAMAREDETGHRRLVAWFVPVPAPEATAAELRAFLQQRLPEHMVPAVLMALPALPLTVNGKVDRGALPAPGAGGTEPARAWAPPSSPEERALADLWAQVLRLDRVGLDDDFFALGGDSILSLRLRSLAAARGLGFDLQDLFRHPTVRELTAVARGTATGPPAAEPFSLVDREERLRLPPGLEDAYPLSALQAGMLVLGDRRESSIPYHNVSSFVLRGPLDPGALRRALDRLAERHPVLRTSFDLRFAEPLQLVRCAARVPLGIADLRGLPAAARERARSERFAVEIGTPLDWSRAPLLRFWVHLLDGEAFELGWAEHHAILDGWSAALMVRELFELYFADLDGEAARLPPPPAASFRDFVALERQAVESAESREYWQESLAGCSFLALPRRSPPPGLRSGPRMRSVAVELAAEDAAGLERLGAAAGLPLKSVLLAAHLRALALLGGSSDVLSGVMVHGRPEGPDGDRVLGLFLNTVPFRLRLPEGSWAALARAVFDAERGMLPHRRLPLAEIQRLAAGGRSLFEVVFNFVHFHALEPVSRLEIADRRGFGETHFPLVVNASRSPRGDGLTIDLQFDAHELGEGEVRALAGWHARILQAMARRPEADWQDDLPLSRAQRHQLFREWNGRPAEPLDAAIGELVFRQAAARPRAAAVMAGERVLTYGELWERASRLAGELRSAGLETPVGVYAGRSPELVVGALAVLLAGGAYLPLDPSYPEDRLSFAALDSGMSVLLVHGEDVPHWAGEGVRVLRLDRPSACEPAAPCEPDPDRLAYVIYTSGSTGRPKGVQVPHRGLAGLVGWHLHAHGIGAGDRATLLASPAFDASVWEIWPCLAAGATLCVPDEETRLSPDLLLAWMAEEAITFAFLPTPLAERVMAAAERGLPAGLRLRALLTGGDRLQRPPSKPLPFAVINHYGPTESSVVATCAAVEPGSAPPSIGRPLPGTRCHVLDAGLALVPSGVAGELALGGSGLARGYLGRPDLTAERFVPDPFAETPGERLYRTGDRVRRRPDGCLEFLGRLDRQIKIRGSRIEPGEIEAALACLPGVRSAVVEARGGGDGQRLVAWLALEPDARPSPAWLRASLRSRLPEPMIPAAWVFLEALPLTANGKVDRGRLPEPEREERSEPPAPPRDATELALVQIWEELLGARPGVHDAFFDLGGHSLLAVRLLGRIEERFGRRLPLSRLAEGGATVAGFARALREPGAAADRRGPVPLQPWGSRRPFFCVHPVGGDVLCYWELARGLGPDRPVWGLRASETELPDLESIAAGHLEALRQVQPQGPYLLGGWSMGGLVACEMARQLEAGGEEVGLLAVIDSAPPGGSAALPEPGGEELVRLFVRDVLGISGASLSEAPAVSGDADGALARLRDEGVRAGWLPTDFEAGEMLRVFEVFRRNLRVLRRYRARAFGGRLLLFHTAGSSRAGWLGLAGGGEEALEIPGDHYSCLRMPHVQLLAEALRERLDRADPLEAGE